MTTDANSFSRGERFRRAFLAIDGYLRQLTGSTGREPFASVMHKARSRSSVVSRRWQDLEAIRELRNAIEHDIHGLLADPTDKAVQLVEEIRDLLLKPPHVDTRPFLREVKTVNLEAPVGEAVRLMYEKDFSQLPVVDQGGIADMLTTNTLARWLGAQVAEDIFSLEEALLKDVLCYREDGETWDCISRNRILFDVVEYFERELRQGRRPIALIITHSGRRHEKPLGIITPWDLPEIYKRIGERR